METYLLALGWWNFGGSIFMFTFLNEKMGRNVFNTWTKMFTEPFVLSYWTRLWLFWAAGINIFFGLINIMAVKWGYAEVMRFLVYSDLIAYSVFLILAIWGFSRKKLGSGAYSVFVIFSGWIAWGISTLF